MNDQQTATKTGPLKERDFKVDDDGRVYSDTMPILTAGTLTFSLTHESARSIITSIVTAVAATGEQLPDPFKFRAGQLLYGEEGEVEARMLWEAPNEQGEIRLWKQEEGDAPTFVDYKDGQFWMNGETESIKGRHLSAVIAPDEQGTPSLHLLFDLRDNAQIVVPSKAHRRKLPTALPYPTFPEAKAGALAISDGRDRRNWRTIEGTLALLHSPKSAAHQVRFEPNNILVTWWGKSPTNAESLWEELKKMDMDSVMLYHVALANILFDPKARFTASLDEMIKAIGREGEAKRSAGSRTEWRRKVWRALLLFDSLAIIGARSGTWREPGSAGEKRDKMAAEKLISRDPLFRIMGTRETQGSFDNSEPPKEVSLAVGEWLMQFHGNREILSEFGDVLKIAAIPRGKAAGNWAACAGLMLNQLWRERAARAARKRAGKAETLDFGTFTRRQLLEKTLRSDHDVSALLQDPKSGHRCREYWKAAIRELKKANIIGHYSEEAEPKHEDWRERWLDQPLNIRPKSAMPQALEINASATQARARTTRKKTSKLEAPENEASAD